MRSVAIIAVVLIHAWGPSTEVTDQRGPLQAAFFAVFVAGSVWAVPLFFFLSGLMLTYYADAGAWKGPLHWWTRRGARLAPPYLFWSAVCLAAAGVTDVRAILAKLATGGASYQMYFVIALLQAYVLWSIIMPWLWRKSFRTQSIILLGAFALSVLVHALRAVYLAAGEADNLTLMRATVLPWIGYFALGCLVALRRRRQGQLQPAGPSRRLTLYFGLLGFTVLCLMVMFRVTYRGVHYDHPANMLLKPIYAVCMIWLVGMLAAAWEARVGTRWTRPPAALAGDAYGIFLCHVLVMQALSGYVFIQLAGLTLGMELAYRMFSLLLTLAVSWGIVRLLSMAPGVRYLSGADIR